MGTLLYVGSWVTGWVFLGLKLAGAISWPWLAVLIPFAFAGSWTLIIPAVLLCGVFLSAGAATKGAREWQIQEIRRMSQRRGYPR